MKNILCYGDSITWGFDPITWKRYDFNNRWTGVLQSELGKDYRIIEEALSGRTTSYDHPYLPFRNGKDSLMMILESHTPLDLVIIMLGINDMIEILKLSAEDSAGGLLSLIRIIFQSLSGIDEGIPKVLIIAPPAMGNLSPYMNLFYKEKEEESKKLAKNYKDFAEQFRCEFLDSNQFIKVAEPDGLHLDIESQRILGIKIAEKVRNIFFATT